MTVKQTFIIAVHGDYSSGEKLQYDSGDPLFVDYFISWKKYNKISRSYEEVASQIRKIQRENDCNLILIGYSRGADFIREYAWDHPHVIGLIGYEPLASGNLRSDIPLLLVTNQFGRHFWTRKGNMSAAAWVREDDCMELSGGVGFHIRLKWGWPPIGHAWDMSLNPMIEAWIDDVIDENSGNVSTDSFIFN